MRSASTMWIYTAAGAKRVAALEPLPNQRATAFLNEVKAAKQLQTLQLWVASPDTVFGAADKEAASLRVEMVPVTASSGEEAAPAELPPSVRCETDSTRNFRSCCPGFSQRRRFVIF